MKKEKQFQTIEILCTGLNPVAVNNQIRYKARVFYNVNHFHPSLIFAVKANSLPLVGSPMRSSPRAGFNLVCNY